MTQEMIDFITPYLVSIFGSYAVPILSVLAVLFVAYKVLKSVSELCQTVKHNDGYKSLDSTVKTLSDQCAELNRQNLELKKQYNELLTEMTRVKHDS